MALQQPIDVSAVTDIGRVHFIGVGGVSMSGIAMMLAQQGVSVSGSDRDDSAALAMVRDCGVRTMVGHNAAHVADADIVVFTTAIAPDNPELAAARASGVRLWHRSAALAWLMRDSRVVAVAGSHGKTTTSGMVVAALADLDPSYMVGSSLAATGRGAHLGTGEWFVVEADESDGSFLQFAPEIAVVTNVEADHLDNWGTEQAYLEGFRALVRHPQLAAVVLNSDDAAAAALEPRPEARRVTYGFAPGTDVHLSDVQHDGMHVRAVIRDGADVGPLELRVPGVFNLSNAAAAYAVARHLGVTGERARELLGGFAGTARRFQPVDHVAGVRIVDDYAHHPTEVRATLTAARRAVGDGRLVVAFQPHLFTRTRDFAADFAAALSAADFVVVTDVYPAREVPIPGVDGNLIARRITCPARYVPDLADVPAAVAALCRPGDVVFTIGAGSITTVGPRIAAALREA